MKKTFILLFILSACGTSKLEPSIPLTFLSMSYNVQPNLLDDTPSVHVNFKAIADENGEIHLGYPNESWGETDLFKCIKNIEITPKADHQFLNSKNEIRVKGDAKKTYSISYDVVQDFDKKLTSDEAYRPIINPNFFHIFGKNLFMMPHNMIPDDGESVKVEINWQKKSGKYDLINSFGSSNHQIFETSYQELYASVFMGGKLNSTEKTWNTSKVMFSTPDTWENIDITKLESDLYSIVGQQKAFWKDQSTDPTTVTLLKTYEDCPSENNCHNSCKGTGLTNSFATFSSDNVLSSNDRLNWLFAHELFHHWVGSTIINESEELEYWFSEGFTDYYAYKLLLRNGMLRFDQFVEKLNKEVIEPHYTSPLNNRPNGDINAENFWSGKENWKNLPYQRGLLYALYLDTKIKQSEDVRSLDNLMHDILDWTSSNKLKFNRNIFLELLNGYKLDEFEQEYESFIEEGNPIDLVVMKIPGIYFETGDVPYMRIKDNLDIDVIAKFFMR